MKAVFSFFLFVSCSFSYGFPQYYYEIKNTNKQKKEFVKILEPLLQRANEVVKMERISVEAFFAKAYAQNFRNLQADDFHVMIKIAKKYRIKKLFQKSEFLSRVDIVPISLGLTQGALESGWGKSRFVREANNIFGHWTWGEVGLVPSDREEGKTHKIRIFNSLQASANAYVLNLNRNYAYKEFRTLRTQYRKEKKKFTGLEAALTMVNYSELDDEYIKILQSMMEKNSFLQFDLIDYKPASLIATD